MAKLDLSVLLWFGAAPVPPERRWYHLWSPLGKFRPHGLPVKQLAMATSASEAFRQETRAIMQTVPDNLLPCLQHYGVLVYPTRDIFEALDWSDYGGPRGHGDRFKWPAVSGLCKREGRLLVLTEFIERDGYRYKADNRIGVFNHELGHCFDRAVGHFSQKQEFLECVARDVARIAAKLSPSQQAALHYFLAAAPQGPSEIFAECFAARLGACAVTYWSDCFKDWFPECYAKVAGLVSLSAAELLAITIDAGQACIKS